MPFSIPSSTSSWATTSETPFWQDVPIVRQPVAGDIKLTEVSVIWVSTKNKNKKMVYPRFLYNKMKQRVISRKCIELQKIFSSNVKENRQKIYENQKNCLFLGRNEVTL